MDKKEITLDPKNVPHHVALIMDGNRRWAKLNGHPKEMGHWQGAETLDAIVRAASKLGIKVLTVYAFSTENWNRSDEEVDMLMQIFEAYLINKRETLLKEGVRLETIGNVASLPENVQKALRETKKATENCDQIELVIAVNYGGRDEIKRAVLKVVEDIETKKITKEAVTEKLFSQYLDTHQWKDPELFIRTSGEKRISNFLIWQSCFSEIVTTDVLWPDFSPQDLFDSILEFQNRNRRFGK